MLNEHLLWVQHLLIVRPFTENPRSAGRVFPYRRAGRAVRFAAVRLCAPHPVTTYCLILVQNNKGERGIRISNSSRAP